MFLNIINNAVKYSSHKEQPKIEIKGTEDGQTIIYKISDNGIGISEKEKHKMFKIFTSMDNAKKFKGNGMGLSIVHRIMKELVEMLILKEIKMRHLSFQCLKNPKFGGLIY